MVLNFSTLLEVPVLHSTIPFDVSGSTVVENSTCLSLDKPPIEECDLSLGYSDFVHLDVRTDLHCSSDFIAVAGNGTGVRGVQVPGEVASSRADQWWDYFSIWLHMFTFLLFVLGFRSMWRLHCSVVGFVCASVLSIRNLSLGGVVKRSSGPHRRNRRHPVVL